MFCQPAESVRMKQRPADGIGHEQAGQHEAGQHAGDEQLGDRDVGGDAIHDHDDGRRNQQAERAGTGQRADGDAVRIAAAL